MSQSNGFWPLKLLSKSLGVHWDSNSQNGNSLGNVRVHSLTLSYTPGSTRCDSRASPLARTLASPCFDCEPTSRVVTLYITDLFICSFIITLEFCSCGYFNFYVSSLIILISHLCFSSFFVSSLNAMIYNLFCNFCDSLF
jgi:hypothetical protein